MSRRSLWSRELISRQACSTTHRSGASGALECQRVPVCQSGRGRFLGLVCPCCKEVWEDLLAREEFWELHLFSFRGLGLLLHPWRELWWLMALAIYLHMPKALVTLLVTRELLLCCLWRLLVLRRASSSGHSKYGLLVSFEHPHYIQEIGETLGFHIFGVQFLIELIELVLFISHEFHLRVLLQQVTLFIFHRWLSRVH